MNCDRTFDVLTRGPFPSGDDGIDTAVERHLSACYDCRQLAEALRPAVGLFHEALAESDSLSLPGYRGELAVAGEGAVRTAVASIDDAPQMRTFSNRKPVRKSAAIAWAFAATCLLGFALGMLGERARSGHADELPASKSHATTDRAPNRDGRLLLASLQLPTACRANVANDASSIYQCCTRCHTAGDSGTAPQVRLTTLTRSCIACHADA